MHSFKRIIAYNSLVQLAGKSVTFGVTIIATAIIANDLGPQYYGRYTIIFAYLSFATVLIDLGLQTIAVREASQHTARTSQLAANLFWIKSGWGFFVLLIFVLGFSFLRFDESTKVGFAIAAIGIFFVCMTAVPNMVFQARLKLQYAAVSDIAAQASFLVFVALITYSSRFHHVSFYLYFAASAIAAIIAFSAALLFASRIEKLTFQFDPPAAKQLVKNTLPLSIIILLSQVHFKGDTLLLSLLKPDEDVGIYGLAYKFFEASLIIPAVLMNVVFPLLSRHHEEHSQLTAIARKVFFILALCGLTGAIAIYFFSPHLLLWAGGKDFAEAVFPLRMLGCALLFSFINTLFAYIVIAVNRQKEILFISISGIIINLLLNIVFIPHYSYNACAAITAVSECYGMCLMGYLAYKTTGFNPFRRHGSAKSQEVS